MKLERRTSNMENQSQPNLQSVQQADLRNLEKKKKRLQQFGVGSALYALFYTICLYHNTSGITYPFFAGGTLLFFGYLMKKQECSSTEGQQTKMHINKVFLITCILIAGILNCTTDSGVLIFFNKLLKKILCQF